MSNVRERLLQQLKKREEIGNLRSLNLNKGLVDFSSNDYLGLARNQDLHHSINEVINVSQRANGSTGSRLLTGNSLFQMDLEADLASYFQAPAALLFNSGYTANLALISTIPQRGDTILYDRAIHTCIKDGARLSNAKCLSFRHNDLVDLQRKLSVAEGNKFVVIESLYSMEGDYAPVEEIAEICREHQAELFVDEAHTTGWAGPDGRGLVVERKLQEEVLARVYTFGKGMGVHGACVAASQELIDYLINFARPFIYTTAMPPHSVTAIKCVLSWLEDRKITREALENRIEHYLTKASTLAMEKSLNPGSPIQWISTRGNERSINLSKGLQSKGFEVKPILSPTVPEGKERLRICLHAFNTEQEITDLVKAISHQL